MVEVNVTEAQANLAQLLARVEQGEEVVITRQGTPIAVLSSHTKRLKRFVSHADLRSTQKKSVISSLEHTQAMREEARY